jgi:autotransporter-associated beta strand protein
MHLYSIERVDVMPSRLKNKNVLMLGTTLAGLGVFAPSPALADCVLDVNGVDVACQTTAPNGYQTTADNIAITVASGATVGAGTGTPSPLLSAGATSAVGNSGTINSGAGSTAISLGAGSTVTNDIGGTISGNTQFAAATGSQVNTFNNLAGLIVSSRTGNPTPDVGGTAAVNGDITSAGGSFVVNNTAGGGITGNITSTGDATISNAGFTGFIIGDITTAGGNDTINNADGGIKGTLSLGDGNNTVNNSTVNSLIVGDITAGAGNDTVINSGGGTWGGIAGDISLGDGTNSLANSGLITGNVTAGTGDDTVTVNAGATLNGAVSLGDGNNSVSDGGTINGDVTTRAGNDSLTVATGGVLAGNTVLGDGNNGFSNAGSVTGAISAGAGNDTLTNTLATGTVTGNIDLGTGSDAISDLVGSGTITKVGSGTLTLSGDNTGFTNAGTALSIGTGGTVSVGATNNMVTGDIAVDGGTLQTTGAASLNNAIALGADGATLNTGAATTLSGDISGAGGLSQTGTGTLTLSGTNTFAGPLTIDSGTLVLQGGAAGGDSTAVVVNSNGTTAGTLQVDDAETIGSLAGTGSAILNADLTTGGDNTNTTFAGVVSGTGGLVKNGTGTFTLAGANTYSGGTSVNGGILAGDTTSLQGDIAVTSPGAVSFGQTASGTYAGNLSGTGQAAFSGTGSTVLTLTGDNSGLTGPMTFASGTVAIGDATNVGTGLLQFNGGTLETTSALTLANDVTLAAGGGTFLTDADTTLSGGISGAGGLTKTGTAALILTGTNTYTGGTTISAGTLQGTSTSLTGDIVDNAALVIDNTAGGTIAGDITGSGSLSTINAGTVTLTGNNTYTGATNVGAGTLVVGPTGIGDASAVTVDNGASLQLAADETIGSLAGAGDVTGAFTLTTGGNNTSTEFSGPLTIDGLTKVGTGTFTLSGTNTLTGPLAVDAGTVDVTGSTTAGTAAVGTGGTLAVNGGLTATGATIDNGGTLTVGTTGTLTSPVTAAAGSSAVINGTVTGDVTNAGALSGSGTVTGAVSNSGSLSPGGTGTTGIFNVVNGPFTQTAAGTLNIDLTPSGVAGTGYDQVLVTGAPGTAILNGTLALHPQTGVLYLAGTNYDIVDAAGGITGAFASTTGATISPFLNLSTTGIVTVSGTDQVYRLTVNRIPYATGIAASATPNQTSVATGFQNLVTGATGDAAALVTAVDNMSVVQAESFFDQVSPEPYGAYANALYNQGELFTRQVALQMHATPNPGDGLSLWGRGYGQWGKGRNHTSEFGSKQDIYGGALGLDYRNGGLTIGAAAGYSRDKIRYRLGNSHGRENSWQFGAYADYAAGPIDFDLQAAYVHGNGSAIKTIDVTGIANVASIARTATASPDGHAWRVIGTVGYNAGLGGSITARPFVGLDWTSGRINSFAETGADAANLTVDDIRIRRTDAVVGVDIGSNNGIGLAPYARLAYKYDLKRHNNDVTAFFTGNPASAFTVSAVPTGRSEFDIDAGLSYGINRNFMIFAGYEGTYRKDLHGNGFSAGLRLSFGGPAAAPPPPPATQTCADGSVIPISASCPVPPPPAVAPTGERG